MEELELMTLLLEAAQYGVTGIVISYEGDKHPYAETVSFTNGVFESAEEIHYKVDPWDDPSKLFAVNDDEVLMRKMEGYFDKVLADKIDADWYDEGGYGTVAIMVPSGEMYINSIVRVMRNENYIYKGSMITGKTEII